MDIEQIKSDIKRLGLDVKSSKRTTAYQRFHMFAYLWKNGMSQQEIATLFNKKTHATVGLGIHRSYADLRNDAYFQSVTAEVRELYPIYEGEKISSHLRPLHVYSKDFATIESLCENGKKKADVIRNLIKNYESK